MDREERFWRWATRAFLVVSALLFTGVLKLVLS
jgi:hypothetical protein